MDAKFLRNQRFAKKGNLPTADQAAVFAKRQRQREARAAYKKSKAAEKK